jgi:aminopeptidase N
MVFPCFDQPNLKAPMTLTITAPSIWKILSNEHPNSSGEFCGKSYGQKTRLHGYSGHLLPKFYELVPKEGKFITTIFPITKVLPTYLYCFIAGDY